MRSIFSVAGYCNVLFFTFCLASTETPYGQYILASSRTVVPSTVHGVNGSIANVHSLTTSHGNATFQGNSSVTFDFGKNIGGIVSLTVGPSTSQGSFLSVTFSESSLWINSLASDATGGSGLDESLWFPVGNGSSKFAADAAHQRGGFRYLTLASNTSGTIELESVSVQFTAAPTQDLQAYTGYFHSNDELLNRIWYAGAYTNQLCSIDPRYGNALVQLGAASSADTSEPNNWYVNYTITNGTSALVDGAKRDRLVWPGDMVISIPSIFASTNDLDGTRNAIESLFRLQKSNGMLPFAGEPFNSEIPLVSFTYHLHNLNDMALYYQYTGNVTWLASYWDQFKLGLGWSLTYVDPSGLMNVTSSTDWARSGMGGHNIEANAILHYTLNLALELALVLDDDSVTSNWSSYASNLKVAANKLLWDDQAGLYRDNETTSLHPQDGNAWAVKGNLTLNSAQTAAISTALQARWGTYGAPAPEAGHGTTISPFIGGFELEAHLLANNASSALDLMRLQWGFMLDDPRMTNSSFIEGYDVSGALHYTAYSNDAEISHAHGWSTGPTSLLSFYVAGIHLTSAEGATWRIAPQVGDLASVDAGFSSALGAFASTWKAGSDGTLTEFTFSTPEGTNGVVNLPVNCGTLVSGNQEKVALENGGATGLSGGNWTLELGC